MTPVRQARGTKTGIKAGAKAGARVGAKAGAKAGATARRLATPGTPGTPPAPADGRDAADDGSRETLLDAITCLRETLSDVIARGLNAHTLKDEPITGRQVRAVNDLWRRDLASALWPASSPASPPPTPPTPRARPARAAR